MTLALSEKDRAFLGGEVGPAAKMAMSILVKMARVQSAREMIDITRAHIDSTIYVGEAGLEFAEKLAASGGRVAVPSTVNVSSLDEHHWAEWEVPRGAEKARRQVLAYQAIRTLPTWTCAPYQTVDKPERGEQIASGESNAIVFANSVIGARTERYRTSSISARPRRLVFPRSASTSRRTAPPRGSTRSTRLQCSTSKSTTEASKTASLRRWRDG